MNQRLMIAGVMLFLNVLPFVIAPMLGETMNLFEIIFGVATVPLSLMVVFMTRDPLRFIGRALIAGAVVIIIGLALRETGRKLVEIGKRMNAESERSGKPPTNP